MERVAVITDIHANMPALEAVLDAIEWVDVDAVYCGGDLVGYGPHPNSVCQQIEHRGIPTIYGNYDYAIARDLEDCGCAYRDQHDRELGQLSVAWTLEHTDPHSKDFMRGLPLTSVSSSAAGGCGWCTGRRARSTSTCSPTSRPGPSSGLRPALTAMCSSSDTPTSSGHRARGVRRRSRGAGGRGRRSARRVRRKLMAAA